MNEIQEQYGAKTDEELLLLSAEIDQLLPEAQEALRAEMRQRGLTFTQAKQAAAERQFEDKIETRRSAVRQFSDSRTWYGKRDRIFLDQTKRERFTTTVFYSFYYVPIIPIATYRVERLRPSGKIIVLEERPLDWEQVLRAWVVVAGTLLAAIWALKLYLKFHFR